MRILALADIHAEFAEFAPDDLPDADVCLIAGDITTWGERKPQEVIGARYWIDGLRRRFPVLWVPGNHDFGLDWASFRFTEDDPRRQGSKHPVVGLLHPPAPAAALAAKLAGKQIIPRLEWRGVPIVGQSLCTAFDAPRLAEQWANMTADPDHDARTWANTPPAQIVVSHSPPFGIQDSAGRIYSAEQGFGATLHIGSPGLRNYIERHNPALVVCGHVHEAAGEVRYGQTRVVNTAQRATLVELEVSGAGTDA